MKALLWANDQRLALIAWWHTRRSFRRYRVSLAERRRLQAEAKRRTP